MSKLAYLKTSLKGDTTLLLLETVVDATNGAEVCPSVTELVDFTAPGVGTFSGMQGRAEGTCAIMLSILDCSLQVIYDSIECRGIYYEFHLFYP